ncbi:HEPN domain-containing protein [candidate division KSB1 bacterium]|nr:HEPN domain-containing protein [candidate division KSB1 bacterium]
MKSAFLGKAKANLAVAQYSLANGFFDVSASRAYYAAFQAAIAALAHHGIKNTKNAHKWVQATFNTELIKRRKIFSSKLRSYLLDMLSVRNDADYSQDALSKKEASQQLIKAEEMVAAITQELSHD